MKLPRISVKAAVAEAVATCLFVYIGTGAATTFSSLQSPWGYTLASPRRSDTFGTGIPLEVITLDNLTTLPSWGIVTALAFGFAITVLVYATAHLSGGQINPAVTLGLALVGALGPAQAVANMLSQIVGAILGSSFLYATIPNSSSSTLGSNRLAPGVSTGNAMMGEIVMTFVLVSVVLETAVNKRSVARAQAPLAIGFAVFTAHAVMLPIDGCSINPARSLGPAIVSGTWPGTFWVFIVGPFVGALFAVPFHMFFRSDWDTVRETPEEPAVGLSPSPSDLPPGTTAKEPHKGLEGEAADGGPSTPTPTAAGFTPKPGKTKPAMGALGDLQAEAEAEAEARQVTVDSVV